MKSKIKSSIIYIIVVIIVIVSLKVPEILLQVEDRIIEMQVYEKQKYKDSIDVEAEKVYLVNAIHAIESEDSVVELINNKETQWVITAVDEEGNGVMKRWKNELLKLVEFNVLNNVESSKKGKYEVRLINKIYQSGDEKYIIHKSSVYINKEQYDIEIEEKTGKILYILFDKSKLYNATKEEILRNYVKYLDLYIIDDWKLEDNKLKSQKAKLVVRLIENEENYMLSIHSLNEQKQFVDINKESYIVEK